MKCAPLLVRTTHTPPALASSPCPYRSLNWVSIFYIYHIVGRKKVQIFDTNSCFPSICFCIYWHGVLHFPFFLFNSPTVHFNAYCPSFIGQYCRVSALLELESLMSQQALREAFSEAELLAAKKKHQQIQEHMQVRPFKPRTKAACFATTSGLYWVVSVASGSILFNISSIWHLILTKTDSCTLMTNVWQQMEEVWRDARWIMDALQYARYKQPTGGISISWIIDFSKEVLPEKPPSTSSQPDFMPSPMPSPEPCRKHSGQSQL